MKSSKNNIHSLLQTRTALKLVMALDMDTQEDMALALKRINGLLNQYGAKIPDKECILPTDEVGLPIPMFDWNCSQCKTCMDIASKKYGVNSLESLKTAGAFDRLIEEKAEELIKERYEVEED